jgi:hypothetical protein
MVAPRFDPVKKKQRRKAIFPIDYGEICSSVKSVSILLAILIKNIFEGVIITVEF